MRPRVLVVFERGRRGAAALFEAAEVAGDEGELTVLTLAPAQAVVRCGPCHDALDAAVEEAAEEDLERARELLGSRARELLGSRPAVRYEMLPGATERTLTRRIESGSYDLVVLPRRRLLGGWAQARRLRGVTRPPVCVARKRRASFPVRHSEGMTTSSPDDQLFGPEHVRVYRETGGQRGYHWRGTDILLLTTTGRASGTEHTTPLIHRTDGDAWVIVASKGGAPAHPSWYANLQATPEATIQVRDEVIPVRARTAQGEERERLWRRMTEVWPDYDNYQRRTDREIPIVVLERR